MRLIGFRPEFRAVEEQRKKRRSLAGVTAFDDRADFPYDLRRDPGILPLAKKPGEQGGEFPVIGIIVIFQMKHFDSRIPQQIAEMTVPSGHAAEDDQIRFQLDDRFRIRVHVTADGRKFFRLRRQYFGFLRCVNADPPQSTQISSREG